ncbi:peptidyl-prolyl cis-trans isomerase CYP26-2, chloroplastic [Rutidosis leptorrhynchoides]|uniref:peptidyl-prolyl cis-trans isomerase CYP26-2, chloroplastic n=1 Tax=Rutidosis leptorrhynchoides TaxID=125765 RepID=UPI003A991872
MEKMWQNATVRHSTAMPPPPPITPPQIQTPETIKLSRRQLAICTKSSALLILTSHFQDFFYLPKARAQEQQNLLIDDIPIETNTATNSMQEISVDDSSTTAPTEETPIENIDNTTNTTEENPVDNGEITSTTEENPVDNGDITSSTEENPVDNGDTMGPAEENPVENRSNAGPTEDNQVETTSTISPVDNDSYSTATDSCTDKILTKRAFLDISIDGQPIGRVVIGLYGNNVPAGTTKFSDFVSGAAGISYRRKEFIKITPNYVQHGGVRSYGVDAELAAKTGRNFAVENLVAELERENGRCAGIKNVAGTVGIIVRDPFKPPPKQKLVARNGKLVIDEEEIGKEPNGTEFVISTKDSPELDTSTLVIGKVLEGMEVVERIGQVKTVQDNTSSAYFRVAKLIGDKRAVVAERGFNRPYSKVIVTNCGLMA